MQYIALNHLLPGQHSPCYLLIKDCGKGILSVVEYNRLRGKKTTLSAEIKSSATKSTLFRYQQCQLLKRSIKNCSRMEIEPKVTAETDKPANSL